ncbi:hypothetical protein K2X14_07040 [Acetobacter sp. TBRC 12305]|uniref:Uncharacterized protein n=1 Tax=Acetobacter garciniae TaxID=2817435 RepID=A0A939HND0_9PROT|nr:hypothetical protein [Acetobacter garciniae]MBO1324899.1 hypothetical protein [Acetobacter garciniae]MBX0344590.1 hypothetical protein [Acetobacter garciniae]
MTKATQTPVPSAPAASAPAAPDTTHASLRMRPPRDRSAGPPQGMVSPPNNAPAATPVAAQQHRAVAEQVVQALQVQADRVEQQALKERQDAIFFDGQWYLNAYPDIGAAGMEPVEHFLKYGAQEKRNPNAIFNSMAYLRANPDVAAFGPGPFLHYVCFGFREKRPLR